MIRPGTIVAERYEILGAVASGGMGTVYHARDVRHGEQVAVKVIRTCDAIEAARVEREATLLASISHPNIVRYLDHGSIDDSAAYLATEWLEGENLADHLARSEVTPREAVRIAERVGSALAAAHARGVIHRDIKPGNVILVGGSRDHVKLIDFGVARVVRGDLDLTGTGMVVGTPGYMAPEQIQSTRTVDGRADLFALGCLLYRCLGGVPPFRARDRLALLARIVFEEPEELASLRPTLPESLCAYVHELLRKDPAGRPRDAASCVETLRDLASQLDGAVDAPRPVAGVSEDEQRLVAVLLARFGDPDANEVSPTAAFEAWRPIASAFRATFVALGDRLVAVTLSNAGSAQDLAARAARCALAMRDALAGARIAMSIGSALLSSRGVSGAVIDRATALLRSSRALVARDGVHPVVIDDSTADLLDVRFGVRIEEPHALLVDERLDASLAVNINLLGRPSAFVGRESELQLLNAVAESCLVDRLARAVVVTGEAGIGKSRLRHELVAQLARRDEMVSLWFARGDALRAGSPFGTLAAALRYGLGLTQHVDADEQAERLRDAVREAIEGDVDDTRPSDQALPTAADSVRVAAFLGEMLGLPPTAEERTFVDAVRTDAVVVGDQMLRAFQEFAIAFAQRQPIAIVLEDLQWGDAPTVRLLDALLRNARDASILVLALARPEIDSVFPRLWAERDCTHVRLSPLSRRASLKWVDDSLGEMVDGPSRARIVEQAAGNPFYLEEIIRHAAGGAGDAPPETVLLMVHSRLEALDPDARRILRAGSVYGLAFWPAAVDALLAGGERVILTGEWLDQLERLEWISPRPSSRFGAHVEYAFRNSTFRDAAYATLADVDRVRCHALAAEWLCAAGESESVVLAAHWQRAGDDPRAAPWMLRAAEHALEGNDFIGVLDRTRRDLPTAHRTVRARMLLLRTEALRWTGELPDALVAAQAAADVCGPGSKEWFESVAQQAVILGALARPDDLDGLAHSLMNTPPLDASADLEHARVIAAARLGVRLVLAGRHAPAADLQRWIERECALANATPLVRARLLELRTASAMVRGDAGSYVELAQRSADAFSSAGDLRSACVHMVNVGWARNQFGQFDDAVSVLRDAMSVAARLSLANVRAYAAHNLGPALLRLGKLDEAHRFELEAVRAFVAQGDRRLEGAARIYLSEILRARGRIGEAEAEARSAVSVLAGLPPAQCVALATLAETLLARGRLDEGLEAADGAFQQLELSDGAEEGEFHVRLTYARALDAVGRTGEGAAVRDDARARIVQRARRIEDVAKRAQWLHATWVRSAGPEATAAASRPAG